MLGLSKHEEEFFNGLLGVDAAIEMDPKNA